MDTIIIFGAKYLYLAIILISLGVFFTLEKKKQTQLVQLLIVAAPIAGLLLLASSNIVSDPRPFVVTGIQPLIPHAADNGFPSDHTLISMLLALAIALYHRKAGLLLIVLAILVGASRVLARVHHPLDIAGSVAIALISIWLSRIFWKKMSPASLKSA